MSEALKLWILKKYKVERYGPPTWRMLLGAIAKIDEDLFKTLAKEHQGMQLSRDGFILANTFHSTTLTLTVIKFSNENI